MSGIVLTPAQARELRALRDAPGSLRQSRTNLTWHRHDGYGVLSNVRSGIVARLMRADLVSAERTPREITHARLLLTDAGRAWLEANP